LDRGQEALIQQIQVAADHEVQALTGKLKKTHGVARMALAQALGSARDRSKAINFAIQEVSSGLKSTSKFGSPSISL
jgi:hypothetical protein